MKKVSIIYKVFALWHEQTDIIFQTAFGILHIDTIKENFLLRFLKDRKRWIHWLFEAKKRFGLRILNYAVTSNHIHLLVIDSGREVIPMSIQLIAGRTAQGYNQRKKRKGSILGRYTHPKIVFG